MFFFKKYFLLLFWVHGFISFHPNAGITVFNVWNGGKTFFDGAPSMLTPAEAFPNSTNFWTAIPAIECPIIKGFSGKPSIRFAMFSTMDIGLNIGFVNRIIFFPGSDKKRPPIGSLINLFPESGYATILG